MWDENSTYPKNAAGFAFADDMKDISVEKFIRQNFTRVSNAILKVLCYSLPDLIIQHIPVKGKVRKF